VVTVLVIACPHALGLAVPLVVAISTTLGARNGLLVRDRRGLEEARNLDTVVFDKTGTLTLGEHRVVETIAAGRRGRGAASGCGVERDSEHPIARALLASARSAILEVPRPRFQALPGQGVQALVEGRGSRSAGRPAEPLERSNRRRRCARRRALRRRAARRRSTWSKAGRPRRVRGRRCDPPESHEAVKRLHEEASRWPC
jgi:P-type Cu2+ transporter